MACRHRRMARETVNTFGLVYTIKGSDSSLKPLMLAAHQDVVPVADDSVWSYPPFSAHYDGRFLWGRGGVYTIIKPPMPDALVY